MTLRKSLADQLHAKVGNGRFDFLADHRGMFSLSGINPQQVEQLRDKHAIYMVGDGRMNIAGLQEERISELADAMADVTA